MGVAMSKVTDTTIGGGLGTPDKLFNRRYFSKGVGNVTKKRTLYRRGDKKQLPTFSFLAQCGDAWALLSDLEKEAWELAAFECDLTGYNLFIQDKVYRLINDIKGNAIPETLHQYLTGHLTIPESTGDFLLKKVGNNVILFPAELNINYKSLLDADPSGGEFLKVRFTYVYDDGGGVEWQTDEISLTKFTDWTNETLAITQQTNPTGVYYLEIEGHNVKGDLYFDNCMVSDLNGLLTSDPYCNDIENSYHGIIVPDGFTYLSEYPQDLDMSFNPPEGFLINGKIVPSVSSNNLTVAIKGMDGNDPSALNPVYIRNGDVLRAITAPLSVTKNAGTNYFSSGNANMGLATNEVDYFVYLGYNATDGIVVGFARMPWGRKYSDFDTTAANSKYCAISTITNASANDYYTVIGRFAATLSASASYNWSIPTFTALNLIQRPIYETRLLTFTSTWYGGSTQGSWIETYKIIGSQMHLNIVSVSEIASNQDYLYTYIPMEPKITQVGIPIFVQNNSSLVASPGHVELTTNDVTLSFYKGFFRTAWTASNNKAVYMPTLVFPLYQL